MTYERLIRFALWAALIAAFSFGAWYMAGSIHDRIFEDGRIAERAEWSKKDIKRREELAQAVAEAAEAMNKEREKQVDSLIGAMADETKAKLDLEHRLNSERIANRGLWVTAKECGSGANGTAGKTQDSTIDGSASSRIRLPGQIEQDLRDFAADAQRVTVQYETARRLVESCPQIEIVSDAEFKNLTKNEWVE